MSKPQEEVWESYMKLLSSKRYDEWGELWDKNGQFIVVYGREEFGREIHKGRENIVSFIGGARNKIQDIYFENIDIWETQNPTVFFVTFDFNAITTSKHHYKNRIVCQVSLNEQGEILKLTEYADPIARNKFIKELQKGQTAALLAPGLIAQHLRIIDRALNQYDAAGRFIPTNVDTHGRVLNRTLGIMNQSRHLYGAVKAYEFTGDSFYLEKAKEIAGAYLKRFVNQSANPPYFFEEIVVATDGTSQPLTPEQLTVNYQAYGLAGLVAFYKATSDSEILDQIHQLHDGFVKRFHDPGLGGFFDEVNLTTGTNNGLKSFNSTVYVATAYLRELAEVEPDSTKKQEYMELLEELANLVVDKFVANEMDAGGTGFIRENFNASWEPQWRGWQKQKVNGKTFTISVVGHNTQVGWFLLEMFEHTNNDKYKVAAVATLKSMLERGFDWKHGGVYDAAKREEPNPVARWMWGTEKHWWQQAETIQALLQADKLGLLDAVDTSRGTGREALEKTVAFWDRFQRPEGGTFEKVREDGVPIAGPLDGPGKGPYHEAQVADVAVQAGGVEPSRLSVKRPAAVYAEIRTALEQKACLQIQSLLDLLAKCGAIDLVDNFGLTISMRAAALGNLEVVKTAHALGASFNVRNPRTNANLLHFAAQAVSGGADIIKWAILEANAPPALLSERSLVLIDKWLGGNGHTVTMEATFNRNEEAVKTLIELRNPDYNFDVDITTPALTGWTPLGFAVREGLPFAQDLARAATRRSVKQEDDAWMSKHPDDKAAMDLAEQLRNCVMQGTSRESIEARLKSALGEGIDFNALYGRLGQPLLNLIPTMLSTSRPQAEQLARYAEVVELLTENGADPRIKEMAPMLVSAGFRDAVFGYQAALEHMLNAVDLITKGILEEKERQAFIDEQGIMNGYTRLIDAASFGRTDIITLLLDNRADKSIKGFNGLTAYEAAVRYNEKGIGEKIPDHVLERMRT